MQTRFGRLLADLEQAYAAAGEGGLRAALIQAVREHPYRRIARALAIAVIHRDPHHGAIVLPKPYRERLLAEAFLSVYGEPQPKGERNHVQHDDIASA